MAEALLVVPYLEFGLEILDALDAHGMNPNVAVWLKDEGEWRLYVSTPGYDRDPGRAHGDLVDALSTGGRVISDYPTRLAGNKSALIRDLRKTWAKKNCKPGTRIGGRYYGPFWYEDGILLRVR